MRVDASNVRELFDYDPATGVMKRRVRMGIHAAGSICSKVNMYGYISTRFHRIDYLVHRLAWIYVNGDVGEFLIDHKNGIRSDNRIENLRSVDRLFNGQNRKVASKNNKSGFLGVSKCGNKWVSQIQHADRKHHLGLYDTPEEANEVYLLAKEMIHAGYVKTAPTSDKGGA
ncbi:HNH endonuclease [Burkholderia multivorans]|uniref:HNH endonuclease signature motif containing protein n=1 Tax=Burkholderia multivorans TaxID=87883 RepID=UPI001C21752F|nr:HNH endonuclease signature motif containing protein [Burkholderia multivorans]MBU9142343.1 HNH endonuclease [Burkholderia multivorans]MBU9537045.1 HNH endonuclease [Burkholderia multivorans]HEF4774340.1 HNH endonuclease [Burkholderia multivorans]